MRLRRWYLHARADLPCQELVELITDYVEGTMAPDERTRFERHLGGCAGCAAYLEQMRLTISTAGRLRTDDVATLDVDARAALIQAFRAHHHDEP